jgi:AcrR family transcriptional regulator
MKPPRERILTAATEHFAAHGYAGARMDEIARAAAVNKAMLYYHVGDKEALYAAVIARAIDAALVAMRAATDGLPTAERKLRAVIDVVSATAGENPSLPALILREIAGGGTTIPEPALRKMAEVFSTVGAILAEGKEQREFREVDPVITHMIIGGSIFLLVAGAPIRRRIRALKGARRRDEEPPREIAGQFADLLLDGLRAGGRKR